MDPLDREWRAAAVHRSILRGAALVPPAQAERATFLHGFFLPFSLIVATLRDAELRGPYLRVVMLRSVLLVAVGVFAVANGKVSTRSPEEPHDGVVVHSSPPVTEAGSPAPTSIHVNLPGLHFDVGPGQDGKASVLGQEIPVTTVVDHVPPAPPADRAHRAWNRVRDSWGWLLALFAFLSATEAVIVFFSRRWDDWLSFHASRLAGIRPEDEIAKTPRLGFDVKWVYRKLKRRLRGYVVFAAGLPALWPLSFLPVVGSWLFTIAATLWGWYWLGIFSASKSAHAWADEATAPAPLPIRALRERVAKGRLVAPLRLYTRLWERLTRSVNPAAATFERSMPAFLGLALARALLSLPGLYFFARPIVPVAAGRLCAESDPANRFSA